MKYQRTSYRTTIGKNSLMILLSLLSCWIHAQNNVGIGTTSPTGKLHIVGSADIPQLIIKANSTQSNTNPLISLRDNSNNTLLWIHSDNFSNCFVGRETGKMNGSGYNNSFFGGFSGSANTSGHTNTGLGYSALPDNTEGYGNTAAGAFALRDNTVGDYNTSIGTATLAYNTSGLDNTAVGAFSLNENTTGSYNVAIGNQSLKNNTTGDDNVAIGESSLFHNVGGNGSVAIGDGAMYYANDAATYFTPDNVAVGRLALYGSSTPSLNTGTQNTAIGANSLKINSSGYSNTATGANCLDENTTGYNNTANGYLALTSNTSGLGNTALGSSALASNTTGSNNTGLGRLAFFTSNNLTNTSCIGFGSGGQVNANNRIEIGNTSVTWIGGEVNWGTYSDGRIKDNVRDDVPGLDFINRLRPVTYNLNVHRQNEMAWKGLKETEDWEGKYDIEQIRMTGFIAQEVEEAADEINYDFSGVQKPPKEEELYSLRYAEFVMPLVKAVQELSHANEALQNSVDALKAEIESLKLLTSR